MKQILQDARSGKLELVEVPAPIPGSGEILVRNAFSVVSPGTEKLAMDFARKSLVGKARSRPDLVAQVTRKLRQEGPLPTYRTVTTRLSSPQPLGYSSAGIVESVGDGVQSFTPGDRVACAGAGYANHAELVSVPENLVARVPDDVELEHAAYATVGAIALQGLRVAAPTLGETAVVVGLGLIGQLVVQLLRANGCRTLGVDPDARRVEQAIAQGAAWGADPASVPDAWNREATGGHGADFVVVAASAQDSRPLQTAAELCRTKGRIALVGAMPMELDRRTFYEKELELRMSMSYGPGRYDRRYEEMGLDYPVAYVRWTENRNLMAFLSLLQSRDLDLKKIESEVVDFSQALRTYDELARGERKTLSVVYRYEQSVSTAHSVTIRSDQSARKNSGSQVGVAFLGAGNYAKSVLLPAVKRSSTARREFLVTRTGASARRSAEQFDFSTCGTDPSNALTSPDVDLVIIATRHDSHAALAEQALRSNKAVWLEKPVALQPQELEAVVKAARETEGFLTVGYNRRFSTHTRAMRKVFSGTTEPLSIHYTVAAGPTPSDSWITDPKVGGGRIVGEVCHFIDLCTHLTSSRLQSVYARALGREQQLDDSVTVMLGYANGSTACIEYLSQTNRDVPKERIEISGSGKTVQCENFRQTRIHGAKPVKTLNQDKGQTAAVDTVLERIRRGEESPVSLDEIASTSLATFAILESVRTGRAITLET
ncbi:bi-domain-containing oxidoreductase [Myxococcota bacterium]|nr:bi-domain-containing oxidoreductase [Myxococcota bacterium]